MIDEQQVLKQATRQAVPAGDRPVTPSGQTVVMLGPKLEAVSGVSTHLNQLLGSDLAREYRVLHFQVGSEGRQESAPMRLVRLLVSPLQLLWFLLRVRPHIVHINTAMEPKAYWRDIGYLVVSRLAGCKIVYQVHGGYLPDEFFPGNRLLTGLLARVLRAADRVILLAQVERTAYQQFIPELRAEVVANALDCGPLLNAPLDRASRHATLKLAYLGRLATVKGIFEIVEAMALLRDRGIDAALTIAGTGPDEAALRQLIAQRGLQSTVTMAGSLFGQAKDQLWCDSDVFVFPTYHREGLPYALLESMAAGAVPVVCPVGAVPDVMTDMVHGVFVPPKDPATLADRLAWMHANRAEIVRMATAGRQRVLEQYSVSRLAADFRDIYRTL